LVSVLELLDSSHCWCKIASLPHNTGKRRSSGGLGGERRRRGEELVGGGGDEREEEVCRIRCATTMGDNAFYNASSRVDSTSENRMEASPPEATREPLVGERGGLLEKCRFTDALYRLVVRALRCAISGYQPSLYQTLFIRRRQLIVQ
jgi:hypothetical protein